MFLCYFYKICSINFNIILDTTCILSLNIAVYFTDLQISTRNEVLKHPLNDIRNFNLLLHVPIIDC